MANVMVRVKGPVKGSFPVPAKPAVIDQKGCQYAPHVLGIRVGQTLQLKNSDGLLHNVHALPKVNTPFNMAMPANRTTADTKFGKEEGMFLVKCDVHPWMAAYVGVFSNPFYAVSGKDGKYKISGLPPGNYEIEAWHEKLGVKTAKVTVTADKPAAANFSFAPPSK
jgi:plastocyanin